MKQEIKPMIYQKDRKYEILHKNNYKGYNYYILNLGTHPTAYVEIPEGHKLYGKHYDDIDIDVHGGLTYSDGYLGPIKDKNLWFIGWDYAHAGDYMGYYEETIFDGFQSFMDINNKKWTTEEIIEDCKDVIEQIIEMGD